MLTWRHQRQAVTISIITFFVLVIFGWIAYTVYPAPTCFDNRKNQQEMGIDCGGSCIPCALKSPKPVELFWARVIPVRQDIYDVVAEVRNVNEVLGAPVMDYEFTLFDDFGVIAQRSGSTFLFPQERIHIVEADLRTTRKPVRIELRVLNAKWQIARVEEIPNVLVERRDYRVIDENGRKKSSVEASILNRTPFDYKEFQVNFLVLDSAGNALGVNRVLVENLGAHSRKTVISIWPEELKGDVARVDVEPRINAFDPNVVLKPR